MHKDHAISLVETYKYSDLSPAQIEERKAFLAGFILVALNIINKGNFNKFAEDIGSQKSSESFNLNDSQQILVKQLQKLLNKAKLKVLLEKLVDLAEESELHKLEPDQLITVYEQTLKRLQEPNTKDRVAKNFDCQLRPDDFSRFLAAIHKDKNCGVYDAFASTGEISNYLSAINPHWHFTTESLIQDPDYLIHKYILVGCDSYIANRSYALSSNPFISAESFDLSVALYEPVAVRKNVTKTKSTSELKGHFDPKRIDLNTIPKNKYNDHAVLQHLIWSIKQAGLAVAFVGRGALQRQEEEKSRRHLIENNLVDAVIQLPTKLINARTVDLFAILLRKNKTNSDVLFIDASSFFERDTRRNRLVDEDEIALLLEKRQNKAGISKLVSLDELMNKNWSLNVATYVEPQRSPPLNESIEDIFQELSEKQAKTNALYELIFN